MFSSPMYAAGSSPCWRAALAFGALPFAFFAPALQGPGLATRLPSTETLVPCREEASRSASLRPAAHVARYPG